MTCKKSILMTCDVWYVSCSSYNRLRTQHTRACVQQHLRASSSSGIVWVKTMASPHAAGGVAIPSPIGLFECPVNPVLLAAPTLKLNYNDGEGEE